MKYTIITIIATSVALFAMPAKAEETCTTYDNNTYCSGSSGSHTCTTYGGNTYCD